jgi:hypothetical protein
MRNTSMPDRKIIAVVPGGEHNRSHFIYYSDGIVVRIYPFSQKIVRVFRLPPDPTQGMPLLDLERDDEGEE